MSQELSQVSGNRAYYTVYRIQALECVRLYATCVSNDNEITTITRLSSNKSYTELNANEICVCCGCFCMRQRKCDLHTFAFQRISCK